MNSTKLSAEPAKEREWPKADEPCWVQCKGYRTMATRTGDGRWWALSDGRELTDVIDFSPPELPEPTILARRKTGSQRPAPTTAPPQAG